MSQQSEWTRAETTQLIELAELQRQGRIEVVTVEIRPWNMGPTSRWFEWRHINADS